MSAPDPTAVDDLVADFTERFGRGPEGRWSAPGRVNVIGEHTDYNAGLSLPVALGQAVTALVAPREDGVLRLASRQSEEVFEGRVEDLEPGSVKGWARYAAGAVWALREDGHPSPGLDVLVDSTVPIGAGLSSSAALESVVVLAASDLLGTGLDPRALARLAQRAENDFAGAPTGLLDQTASLCCTEGHALLVDFGEDTLAQVPFDLRRHGLVLLVVDTRAHHDLADGQYGARRETCEAACRALGIGSLREAEEEAVERLEDDEQRRRARHVVTENARVVDVVALLRAGDVERVGPLLSASHASLRDDYEVSCAELDVAAAALEEVGALGARMTGGGFGGSVVALVRAHDVAGCQEGVARAFAAAGYAEPACFEVLPGPGARRLAWDWSRTTTAGVVNH